MWNLFAIGCWNIFIFKQAKCWKDCIMNEESERDRERLTMTRSGHDVDGLHRWQIYLERGLSFNLRLCEELLHICHPILQFHQHLELWILQHTIRTLVTTNGVSCAFTHVQPGGTSRHISHIALSVWGIPDSHTSHVRTLAKLAAAHCN